VPLSATVGKGNLSPEVPVTAHAIVWLGIMALTALAVAAITWRLTHRRRTGVPPLPAQLRGVWLVAAIASFAMLIFIASEVRDLLPNVTGIDLVALAVSAVLAGFFFVLGVRAGKGRGALR